MRTTIRIDDDLLEILRHRAYREKSTLGRVLNRLLRASLANSAQPDRPKRRFRQKTFAMGEASFDTDKALQFAAALEDEEIVRKLDLRK